MSNKGATPEQLPESSEYQKMYRDAVKKLIRAGKKRCRGLHGCDVVGAYFSAGTSLAEKNLPGYDVPALLREIADDLDRRKSKRTLN